MLFRRHHETNSVIRNLFYQTFGFPHIGTRIRGNAVFQLLDLPGGSSILDIGSGYGLFSLEMRKRGYKVISSDLLIGIAIDKIKKAREIFRKGGQPFIFTQSDATMLPFKDGSFDGVLIADVIEHILDEDAALREIRRVLKKGGIFIASTPTVGFHSGKFKPLFRKIYEKTPLWKLNIWNEKHLYPERMMEEKGHLREYSLEKWKNLCKRYGSLEAWKPEYKFFGALFVELSHTFKFLCERNVFFPVFYPLVFIDKFVPTRSTGIAIKARKE
jgi:ubiquinone/menaquinone biosynthesis C-methylase UbiE